MSPGQNVANILATHKNSTSTKLFRECYAICYIIEGEQFSNSFEYSPGEILDGRL